VEPTPLIFLGSLGAAGALGGVAVGDAVIKAGGLMSLALSFLADRVADGLISEGALVERGEDSVGR